MKKILISCLFAAGFGFAQNPLETPAAATESSPAPESAAPAIVFTPDPAPVFAPAPQAAPSSPAPQGKTMFDVVRGHAYNPYAIAGAANNIGDLIITPSEIHGKKFAYISPTDKLGFAAFDFAGNSMLLGLSNSDPMLAALILGFSTSAFGAALEYSVGKAWGTDEYGLMNYNITEKYRYTYPGDNIRAYFSMPLGSAGTIYANAGWLTNMPGSYFNSVEGAPAETNGEQTESYSTMHVTAGLLGNISSLDYDLNVNVIRESSTFTSSIGNNKDSDVAIDPDNTGTEINVNFNIGHAALQSQTARVIVGFNNTFGILLLDKVEGDPVYGKSGNVMSLFISPNVLGEVQLFDNWLAFSGATHDIAFLFGDRTDARDKDRSSTAILQGYFRNEEALAETAAFAGIRYQRANWAMEAQVSANPFEALNGNNIFANFGGFIYF